MPTIRYIKTTRAESFYKRAFDAKMEAATTALEKAEQVFKGTSGNYAHLRCDLMLKASMAESLIAIAICLRSQMTDWDTGDSDLKPSEGGE